MLFFPLPLHAASPNKVKGFCMPGTSGRTACNNAARHSLVGCMLESRLQRMGQCLLPEASWRSAEAHCSLEHWGLHCCLQQLGCAGLHWLGLGLDQMLCGPGEACHQAVQLLCCLQLGSMADLLALAASALCFAPLKLALQPRQVNL